MPRVPIESCTASTVTIGGREYIAFGGCNYLGLGNHTGVKAAVVRAMDRLGLTTSASRETSGNTVEHDLLEEELAAFLGFEAAVLMPEGYTANLALAQALGAEAGRGRTLAVIDQRSHRSIKDAVESAGFEVALYGHLEHADARAIIDRHPGRRIMLWTDGVFAADGSIAPLPALLSCLRGPDDRLVVDDCHGLGVLGAPGNPGTPGASETPETRGVRVRPGRGTIAYFGLRDRRLVWTSTLAKGLGCYGGAIAGTRAMIDAVRADAGIYKGTTPVPPVLAAACREALRVVDREPGLVESLARHVRRVRRSLADLGLAIEDSPSAVMTFVLDSPGRMRGFAANLMEAGIFVPLIDYPNGPAPLYFRLSVCAMHTDEQIEALIRAMEQALAAPGVGLDAAGAKGA